MPLSVDRVSCPVPLTNQKLFAVATQTRQWAEQQSKLFGMPPTLDGMCGAASVHIVKALKEKGIQSEIALADGHAFVLSSGYVVDVTATQFGEFPPVLVQLRSTLENKWWWKYYKTCSVEEFLYESRHWPELQQPITHGL